MAPQETPGDAFVAMLRAEPIKMDEVRAFLDALSHEDRVAAIRAAGRREQSRLYEAADGYGEVRLVDLVPEALGDEQTVRHFGKNTLPAFTHFEKRFCRPTGQPAASPAELWGFNFQTMSPVTGPGYYIAREAADRGEVLVDYRSVPPRHLADWPPIRPNERGLSRFVYGFMVDTLRRVSEHVTIGSAARKGKDMGSWFLLTRDDRRDDA